MIFGPCDIGELYEGRDDLRSHLLFHQSTFRSCVSNASDVLSIDL